MRGIDIFDRGHDVDGLIRDLTSWRGPSNCEDVVVVVGFCLLVGDFRHDCGCLRTCLEVWVGDKEVPVGVVVKLCRGGESLRTQLSNEAGAKQVEIENSGD